MSLPCNVKIIQSDGFDFQLYILKYFLVIVSHWHEAEGKNIGLLSLITKPITHTPYKIYGAMVPIV